MKFCFSGVLVSTLSFSIAPWFKRQSYAQGAYTGYAVKTIPAVHEALEQSRWSEAEQGARRWPKLSTTRPPEINDAAGQFGKTCGTGK